MLVELEDGLAADTEFDRDYKTIGESSPSIRYATYFMLLCFFLLMGGCLVAPFIRW